MDSVSAIRRLLRDLGAFGVLPGDHTNICLPYSVVPYLILTVVNTCDYLENSIFQNNLDFRWLRVDVSMDPVGILGGLGQILRSTTGSG